MSSGEFAIDPDDLDYEDRVSADLAQRRQKLKTGIFAINSDDIVEKVKEMAIKKARNKVIMWIVSTIVSIMTNPITLIILGVLLLAIIAAWCVDEKIECIKTLLFDLPFGTLIDLIKG